MCQIEEKNPHNLKQIKLLVTQYLLYREAWFQEGDSIQQQTDMSTHIMNRLMVDSMTNNEKPPKGVRETGTPVSDCQTVRLLPLTTTLQLVRSKNFVAEPCCGLPV